MIIKIEAYENGAHANQSTVPRVIPEGWAVVPNHIEIPETFPFVDIEVKNGVVTSMTAGVVPEEPEPEPVPEPEPEPTLDDRVTAIETAIADGLKLYEEDLSNA